MNISVIVTCYNESEYIYNSIKSVIRQNVYEQILEIIVVDDGSEDGSDEIIKGWEERCKKVKYIYQENEGLPSARNTGIELSSGEFIALQDGDDIWLEDRLERQLSVVEEYPDVGLVYSDVYSFGDGQNGSRERGYCNRYEHSDDDVLQRLFVHGGPIIPSTTLINRDCFRTVGRFDPVLLRGQDTDMWLRIAAEYPIHHVDEPLVLKRQRGDSLGADVEEKARYLLRVTDKIVDLYPELEPLQRKRCSKIYGGIARHLVVSGKRTRAVNATLRAIRYDPSALKQYATLMFALLPVSASHLRRLRSQIQDAKSFVQSYLHE
ncbi:glycosyltransferase involved in cell wall biosynthesis [Salinibacter ruber]|uniref:glycosyltransferase family 2 protein n=1 Tax=Salinibacter ruber TaxID=146919 RepID=UPI00216A1AEC|nr:glycosyltransferase [Salinibacter ruber]MCS4177385.1 glycosyltransferase involved in cell wall biosynthesis [Salinibacter ruber]